MFFIKENQVSQSLCTFPWAPGSLSQVKRTEQIQIIEAILKLGVCSERCSFSANYTISSPALCLTMPAVKQ